jgi:hypothetical protein
MRIKSKSKRESKSNQNDFTIANRSEYEVKFYRPSAIKIHLKFHMTLKDKSQ